jgi:hypothetical protein
MLAGLPKAPSAYNPVVNPKRAAQRQQYVLRRMAELGFISEAEHRQAVETPLKVVSSAADLGGSADYIAEMARDRSPTNNIAMRPTPRASRSSPPSSGQSRKPPTRHCAAASSTTTGATVTAAPRATPTQAG